MALYICTYIYASQKVYICDALKELKAPASEYNHAFQRIFPIFYHNVDFKPPLKLFPQSYHTVIHYVKSFKLWLVKITMFFKCKPRQSPKKFFVQSCHTQSCIKKTCKHVHISIHKLCISSLWQAFTLQLFALRCIRCC